MILVVDSNKEAALRVAELVRSLGFHVEIETKPRNVFEVLRQREKELELVLFDIVASCREGFEILRGIKHAYPFLAFVVSGLSSEISTALQAIRCGAVEFLPKPIERDTLSKTIERIKQSTPQFLIEQAGGAKLIGGSEVFLNSIKRIQAYAQSELPILIVGDAGTGKTAFAEAAVGLSGRGDKARSVLDLDLVPAELRSAALFGLGEESSTSWTKGGKLAETDSGTLIIESIELLSPNDRANLLRYFRTGSYFDAGGRTHLRSAARIIATSNSDVRSLVEAGNYSSELMAFLGGQVVRIPSLYERKEDIAQLARYLVQKFSVLHGKPNLVLGRGSLEILTEYNYRGNVRELSNVIQSSVLLCDSFEIQACHLPARILEKSGRQKGELEDMQLRTVFRILSECGGNQTAAAKRLGVARGTLNRMLRRIQSV